MKTAKTAIPPESLVQALLPADYTDTFQITTMQDIHASPDDIMVDFWLDMPGWVNALLKLRNVLVRFVGLKGDVKKTFSQLETCIRTGTHQDFASVPMKNEKETVMVLADKHLDAYISIYKESTKSVSVSTLVYFHRRLGKIYFFFIKPFHALIVRTLLKRTIKKGFRK